MKEPRVTLGPDLDKLIAEIDEFKGRWEALKTFSPDRLSALRKVATIESVGSSTRIEGAKLSESKSKPCYPISRCVRLTTRTAACVSMVMAKLP